MGKDMLTRDYEAKDEDYISELFSIAFGRHLNRQFWQWRYLENPYGRGIIRLMFDENRLIGHYAVAPIPLMVEGQQVRAALSMTTMTHPDYRKKGIFLELASDVYSACEREGIRLVLGFANKNSYHGLTSCLDWIGFGQVTYGEITGYQNSGRRIGEGYSYEKAEIIGREMDSLWERLKVTFTVVVPRNSKYLNWRFIDNPIENYTMLLLRDHVGNLQGYVALKTYQSDRGPVGHIVDMLVSNEAEAIENLIYAALEYFRDVKAETVAIWMYLPPHIKNIIRKIGFMERNWVGFDMKEWPTYFGIRLFGAVDERLKKARKLESWYITMGDSDVF